jgi:MYXO-CTERM domain-containing protein
MLLLKNGSVLAAGGETVASAGANVMATNTAELYDPASSTWSHTGNTMKAARTRHLGVLLADGRVLVAGGASDPNNSQTALSSAEIYDPSMNSWIAAHAMITPRTEIHDAAVLLGGVVLVAGGENQGSPVTASETYDPAAGAWTTTADLKKARSRASAVVLSNGKVLMAGGGTYSSELYDPSSLSWTTTTGQMQTYRYDFTLNAYTGGVALAIGGDTDSLERTVETFDPSTATWTTSPDSLQRSRAQHTTTVLGDGRLFVAGGQTNTAEVYNQPQTCNSNADCLSGFCSDSYCCDTACGGGCDRCDMQTSLGICKPIAAGSPGTSPVCAPFLCDGKQGGCPTMCQTDTDCSPGNTCHGGICGSELPNGKPCGDGIQCVSGICSDGVCCNTQCDGSCESCTTTNQPGMCVVVQGAPVANHTACLTVAPCGGQCNGISAQCTFPGTETSCGTASCVNSVVTLAAQCDGSGSCVAGAKSMCSLGCSGEVCAAAPSAPLTKAKGCGCGSDGSSDAGVALLMAAMTLTAWRRRAMR